MGQPEKMKRFILGVMIAVTLFTIVPTMQTITVSAFDFPITLTLNATTKEIVLGEKFNLEVNAQDKARVRWMSDNPKIATVNDLGEVTAISLGTTTIRAAFGGMMVECKITVKLADITGAKVVRSSNTALKVSWEKVPNASGYVVYRSTKETTGYKAVKTITKGSTVSFNNTKLKNGTTYYYKVRAYKTVSGKKVYGEYTAVLPGAPLKTPAVTVKSTTFDTITVSWKKLTGASGYEIYRCETKDGVYTLLSTVSGNANTKHNDTTVVTDKTYYYKVRAYKEIGAVKFYGAYSGIKSAKSVLPKPTVKLSNVAGGIEVSWDEVIGATEYEVQVATSAKGTYTSIGAVPAPTLRFHDITTVSGKTYYYRVKTIRGDGFSFFYSEYSAVKSLVYLTRPLDFNCTLESGTVALTWGKIEGADGYVIQRSTDGGATYKAVTTITKGGTVKYTDKKVTAGTTYHYRIRAYKTVGKTKVYGAYSILGPVVVS